MRSFRLLPEKSSPSFVCGHGKMVKISVITATYRTQVLDGRDFLLSQAKGLAEQTFQDFEWIVIDDLYGYRDITFGEEGITPVWYGPPRGGVKTHFAAASAWNTGFIHAQGELVYFMNDYIGLSPLVLERHWQLYQDYGPKVIISGRLVGMKCEPEVRKPEQGVGDQVGEVVSEEYIRRWYWAGRNDSAPLESILDANGFDERCDGAYGGQDCELAMRLVRLGCRYLIDEREPAYEYVHPGRKPSPGQGVHWQELFASASAGRTWAPNDWVIREHREQRRNAPV